MVMKQYRVMIVDDHPLMRRGIKQLLGLDARFSVVAEAGNGSRRWRWHCSTRRT